VNSPFSWLFVEREKLRLMFSGIANLPSKIEPRDIPLSRNSKIALAYAAREAESDHHYAIDADFLLRGVLCTGDETAALLIAAGHTLPSIRSASGRARGTRERLPIPWGWWLRHNAVVVKIFVILLLLIPLILYLRSQR
jgi:hypothetical protein